MATNESALLNKDFLKKLFSECRKTKVTYGRITSLDIEENPIQAIEGRITTGTVNLDGKSALRRTCSLSIAASEDTEVYDSYWGLTTKFRLEQGLLNEIDPNYPDIIWFPLGTYIITSFSTTHSTNSLNISISGKDKMCLLNGDVSGAIYASVDFGTEEVRDEDGNTTIQDMEIPYIIREAVHEYAHEPWHNIIIKDLPVFGLNLMEWEGDLPLYIIVKADGSSEISNFITDRRMRVYTQEDIDQNVENPTADPHYHRISNEYNSAGDKLVYLPLSQLTEDFPLPIPSLVGLRETGDEQHEAAYNIVKIESGGTAGYELTSLIYPRKNEESGLVANVGDTVTVILDKIVDFLGNYEYFYNEKGQFIFQRKDKYVDTHWSSIDFDNVGLGNPYSIKNIFPGDWDFEDNELITTYTSSPNLNNIKNDYSIWGTKTSVDGSEIPIHLRYAVDTKPKFYKSIEASVEDMLKFSDLYPEYKLQYKTLIEEGGKTSITYWSLEYWEEQGSPDADHMPENTYAVDWRELIYQMALDYRKFNHWDDFNIRIIQANGSEVYPGGITGYEQYYVDLEGFWRYLYRPPYDENKILSYELLDVYPDEDDAQVGTQKVYIKTYYRDADDYLVDGPVNTYEKQYSLSNDAGNTVAILDSYTTSMGATNLGEDSKVNKVPLEIYINRNLPFVTTAANKVPLHYIKTHYTPQEDSDIDHLMFNFNNNGFMPNFNPGVDNVLDLQGHELDFRFQTIKGSKYNNTNSYYFDMSKNYFYVKNNNTNTGLYDVINYDTLIDNTWSFDAEANRRGLKCENYSLLISYDDKHTKEVLDNVVTNYNLNHSGINDNIEYNSYKVYKVNDQYQMFQWLPEENKYKLQEVSLSDSDGVRIVNNGQTSDYVYLPSGFRRALNDSPYTYYNKAGEPIGKGLTLKNKYTFWVLTKVKPLITSFSYPGFAPVTAQILEGTTFYQVDFNNQISFSEISSLDEIALQLPFSKEDAYNPGGSHERIGMIYSLTTFDFTQVFRNSNTNDPYITPIRLEQKYTDEDYRYIGDWVTSENPDYDPMHPDAAPRYLYEFRKQPLSNNIIRFSYYVAGDQLKTTIPIIERSPFNDLVWTNAETGESASLDRDSGHTYLQRDNEAIMYYTEAYKYNYNETFDSNSYWNVLVKDSPESLIFWFDFLDEPYSEIGRYGVKQVMDRSKAENNSNASAICFRDTLNLVYYYSTTPERLVKGALTAEYDTYKMSESFSKYFKMSNANKSCKDILDNWLYNYTYANESISITTVPIYTLQPNNRINVAGDNFQVKGEYVVNSLSIPLTYNGLSTLQCTRIVSNLY